MRKQSASAADAVRPSINDCWNRIGVRGDSSCSELEKYIHCRNCPVYATAAADLLDTDLPADHLAHWSSHVAQPKAVQEAGRQAVAVFRIGDEWLALPSILFEEIAPLGVIHAVPHRRNGMVVGLTNIRGKLLPCVSLREVLSLQAAKAGKRDQHRVASGRFMVIQREGNQLVCPVDEMHGILRFHRRQQMPVPATLAKATAAYTLALFPWEKTSIGLLDDQLLFYTLNRCLA